MRKSQPGPFEDNNSEPHQESDHESGNPDEQFYSQQQI